MDLSNNRMPSESLKKILSKGGHLTANRSSSRMFFSKFVINGVNFCRPHLLIHCNLCQENNTGSQDDCNEERNRLSLRSGGDRRLNKRAEKWEDRIQFGLLKATMEVQQGVKQTQGQGIPSTLVQDLATRERAFNEELLADVAQAFKDGASQCCYWGCQKPDAEKLSKCTGCGVVTYCSKEHQRLDWKWEHKWECTRNVPQFVLNEIEADRQRNLLGDYEQIDRMTDDDDEVDEDEDEDEGEHFA